MNKYIKIITVFFLVIHSQQGLGMQLGKKQSLVKAPPTLDRSFHEHQKMLNYSNPLRYSTSVKLNTHEDILHSFGKEPIKETTQRYLSLPENEKPKVMDALSQKKQLELMMGNDETKFSLLYSLFNGNEKAALTCTTKLTSDVLCRYGKAQQLMKEYPITCGNVSFGEQHYMVLTDEEAYTLSSAFKKGFIYKKSDVGCLINAFSKLQCVDPQLKKLSKNLTSSIKLYPSLSERATILWNTPGILFLQNISTGSIFSCVVSPLFGQALKLFSDKLVEPGYYSSKYHAFEKGIFKGMQCNASIALSASLVNLYFQYPNYKNVLNNTVLPTQPSLTDLLHERAIQSKPQ